MRLSRTPSLRTLRVFCSAARHCSFKVAADELFLTPFVAACAPQHAATIARFGRHVFRELPLIVHRPRPFAWASWAEEIGLDAPESKSILELNTMSSIVSAAESGLGVALVPEALCSRRFHSGTLVRVFPVQVPIKETYFLACRAKDV